MLIRILASRLLFNPNNEQATEIDRMLWFAIKNYTDEVADGSQLFKKILSNTRPLYNR